MNNLQFNEVTSISSIIIIYELLILVMYLLTVISKNNAKNLVSWLVVLNFFIIFVMFLTDCKVDNFTKLWVVSLKTLILFFVLLIADFSFKNYIIGLLFLSIYFVFSNINEVYSCNIKMIDLAKSLLISSIIYLFLILYQHSSSKSKN